MPSVDQENARDLVRAREDCRGDLMRARHRLSKLLLRQGIVYSGGHAWTAAHDAWLRRQRFEGSALQMTFESDYDAVLTVKARRDRLDAAIAAMAADSEFTPTHAPAGLPARHRHATGFALAVELGDWHRFTGHTIGSFIGLVPSEYSSGTVTRPRLDHQDRQHPRRRLLVEAAWHHRRSGTGPGKTMHDRWELAPPAARARGDAGNRRLNSAGTPSPHAARSVRRRQRRHRPRACGLVLVPGRPRRLGHPSSWFPPSNRPA